MPVSHHLNDFFEGFEVLLLHCVQWISFKKGNHSRQEILTLSHNQNRCLVVIASAMILLDYATVESLLNRFKNMKTRAVLAEMKFRHCLSSQPDALRALKGNMKATFTIDKPCDVVIAM